jgi:sugar lactone lactonase YvrE
MRNRLHGQKKGILLVVVVVVGTLAAGLLWTNKRYVKHQPRRWYGYLSSSQNLAERGDGGAAKNLRLYDPMGIDQDGDGNVYISDRGRGSTGGVVWKIDLEGAAHAVAGTGLRGLPYEGDQAVGSNLGMPQGMFVDGSDRLYFADSKHYAVFRIDREGRLSWIAGSGRRGFKGDGGLAIEAEMNTPHDIQIDSWGNLYVADVNNHRIRKITPDGFIRTVAGTGEPGYSGDGGPAEAAQLNTPYGVFIDRDGRLLIADSSNHVVRRVDARGVITTIAGVGQAGYAGDGGPAQHAMFDSPQSLTMDATGRLYVGDEHNHVIRLIETDGLISTLAGSGEAGFAKDGQSAARASLNDPENVLVRDDASVLITDGDNARVLLVKVDGSVWSFAGGARASPAVE